MFSRDQILNSIKDLKTCLKPSTIPGAGVGVFSLRDIQKDESIFNFVTTDHHFNYDEIKHLPDEIQKHIWGMTDGIGDGFNLDVPAFMIYTAYYINHSHSPNVFWDRRSGEIFSIRDIKAGEELTTYYKPDERDF